MTTHTEVLPIRYCHGCGQYDNHPRVHHIQDFNNPINDKLYHYDCAPDHVLEDHPEIKHGTEAANRGVKGSDLRSHMATYAASIEEAPAEPILLGAFIESMAPGVSIEGLPTPLADYIREAHGKLLNHIKEGA